MKKIVALTSLSMLISSCHIFIDPTPKGWPLIEPRPLTGTRGFPSTDTDYGKGFRAGCGAAMDAVSKGITADFNAAGELDVVKMSTSDDYNLAWFDGYEQCTYMIDWNVV